MRRFLIQLILAIAVGVLLARLSTPLFDRLGHGGEFVQQALAFLVFLSLYLVVRVVLLRGPVKEVLRISESTEGPASRVLLGLTESYVREWHGTLRTLTAPDGAVLSSDTVNELSNLCFQNCRVIYNGTDSHVPSEFMRIYGPYLGMHIDQVQRGRHPGFRVLIVTEQALQDDYAGNNSAFMGFWNLHIGAGIHLRQLDPHLAAQLASESLGMEVTDIGIWDWRYAILFKDEGGGTHVRLRLRLPRDQAFARCVAYMRSVVRNANTFSIEGQMVRVQERDRRLARAVEDDLTALRVPGAYGS